MKLQASQFRRFVVLDIETASLLGSDDDDALDALSGRVVCICMLVDEGHETKEMILTDEDETKLLTQFWSVLQPTDVVIGHNVLEFDIPFLRQRSWILGIKPTRAIDCRKYYTEDVIDTMQLWTNWGFRKYVKLEVLGQALGCGCKAGHGGSVAQLWAARDLASIAAYCMADVLLTYRVFFTVSQTMLRHAKPDMTAVYTHGNFGKALDAQRMYMDQLLKMKPALESTQ